MKTIQQAHQRKEVVLFLDPVHQVHNVENGYCWQLKGRVGTQTVLSNSGRQRLTIIGALNAHTRQPTILTTEGNCNGETMSMFFVEMRKKYPLPKTVHVFLDNARYNHSRLVAEEAKRLNIRLLFLPPYSPNLNIIERLWKFMKKKVTTNRYYRTFAELTEAIHHFFKYIGQYQHELDTLLTMKFEIL